jgi:CYTH domain-containing protein
MAKEIERKFLLNDNEFVKLLIASGTGKRFRQGYLSVYSEKSSATVRLRAVPDQGYKLTVKGPKEGATCDEFEYDIPPFDGSTMWPLCQHKIEKTRFCLPIGRFVFEIDVFHGVLEGLVVAEIELFDENDDFPRPGWLGKEVTEDSRYSNSNLGQITENWEVQTLLY